MRSLSLFVLVMVSAAALPAAADENAACSVAFMPLDEEGIGALEAHIPVLLGETMSHEIADVTSCRVVTERDIRAMIDYEAQAQACGADTASCLAEIGDALGVDFVVSGTVGKLGNIYTMNIRMVDIEQSAVIKRSQRAVTNDPSLLRRAARDVARELFNLPPLDEEDVDVVEGSSFSHRLLVVGGFSALLVGLGAFVLGGASTGALVYLISFERRPAFQGYKQPASFVFPFAATVLAVSLVTIPVGTLMLAGSFVVE